MSDSWSSSYAHYAQNDALDAAADRRRRGESDATIHPSTPSWMKTPERVGVEAKRPLPADRRADVAFAAGARRARGESDATIHPERPAHLKTPTKVGD